MINKAFTHPMNYRQYIKYLLPSVISMIFLSFYTTIDGYFVSHYVNADALAAINIVIPMTCLFFGVSVMMATGSGAIIGIRQGRGDKKQACEFFSFVTVFMIGVAVVLTVGCYVFLDEILKLSGSTPQLDPYTHPYGLWTVLMIPAMVFKLYFEYYTRIDGHPKMGLFMSFLGLTLNLVLDWYFIAVLDLGITGAGMGTAISMYISALAGLYHFTKGNSNLKFVKPKIEWRALAHSCTNGISEMMTELSTGVTTLMFNLALLKYAGEAGVASMSVITYFYYFFTSLFFGITTAGQPVISYNVGAENHVKLHQIVKQSFVSVFFSALFIVAICLGFTSGLVHIFTDDPVVLDIAISGVRLFTLTFVLCGFNIFISGYFTAIGNGGLSALVSFCRSLIFVVIFLMTLPKFIGLPGVWLTNPMAELCTFVIAVPLFMKHNTKTIKHPVA